MKFQIGGNSVQIEGVAQLAVNTLSDDEIEEGRAAFTAAGVARGLWPAQVAGSLAVAAEQETPTLNLRDQLLDTVTEGAQLYVGAIKELNKDRPRRHQISTLEPEEYRERAEDWLSDTHITASTHLPATDERPLLIVPRLTQPITRQETVASWQSAADGKLWPWQGRTAFLEHWTPDQLSGFNPEAVADADHEAFAVIPTAYDTDREGTVKEQHVNLTELQKEVPELQVAAIFDGALLARRYMGQPRNWQDSYVRAIDLAPTWAVRGGFVPNADMNNDGYASVFDSYVRYDDAARLLAR
jgi:hypothetical protein